MIRFFLHIHYIFEYINISTLVSCVTPRTIAGHQFGHVQLQIKQIAVFTSALSICYTVLTLSGENRELHKAERSIPSAKTCICTISGMLPYTGIHMHNNHFQPILLVSFLIQGHHAKGVHLFSMPNQIRPAREKNTF